MIKYHIKNWITETVKVFDKKLEQLSEQQHEILYSEICNATLHNMLDNLRSRYESGIKENNKNNSLLLWVLGITDIFPLEHIKIKNPGSMCDIDVDIMRHGRQRVIEYVSEKYGKNKVSQIATFGLLKAKNAIRSSARALGYSVSDGETLSKHISNLPNVTLNESIQSNSELQALIQKEPYKKIMQVAISLENLPDSIGVNASGIIITDNPIEEYVPLMLSKKDNAILTQYEYKDVEANYVIKLD